LKISSPQRKKKQKGPSDLAKAGVDSMGLEGIRILDQKTRSGEKGGRRTRRKSGLE
jgi:hypothetical protein